MAKTTGIASIAQGRTDIHRIDPKLLNIKSGWNSRDFNDPENIEHVDEIARSAIFEGIKEPLTVYWEDGKAYVSDGECRLRAALRTIEHYKAEVKTVPCKVEERYANDAARLLNQYIRNTGKRFSPMEMSNHFKRLLNAGYSAQDISNKTGLTPGRVSQILDLQTLPEPVKQMVQQGQVSASLAAKTVAEAETPSEAEKTLQAAWGQAIEEGKSKVTPTHIEATSEAPSLTGKALVIEVFEFSAVDNDSDDDNVIIHMPRDWWNKLKDDFGL